MVHLLAQLYAESIEVERLKVRMEGDRTSLLTFQFMHDEANADWQWLSVGNRDDYVDVLQTCNNMRAGIPDHIGTVKGWLEEGQASLERGIEKVGKLWPQVYELSQEYFDACFDANFGTVWSAHRVACINMRRRLVDPNALIVTSRGEVHRLKYELMLVRREIRNLALQATTASLSEATRTRNTNRTAELVRSEQDIGSQLFPLQAVLALREEKLQQSQTNAIRDLIEPLLGSAGAMPPPRRDSEAGSSVDSLQRSSLAAGGSSPAPATAEETTIDEPTLEDLMDRYRTCRNGLEMLQRQLGEEKLSRRGRYNEVDNILTFTNLGPEQYAAFIARHSETADRILANAEEELHQAQEVLLAAGGQVPAESIASENPSIRSRRTTDTARVRNLRRRRINDYRFSQRPVRPASMTTRSRNARSIPEFGTLNSWYDGTAQLTPSPGRDQRLRQYQREQDLIRDQENQRRVDAA